MFILLVGGVKGVGALSVSEPLEIAQTGQDFDLADNGEIKADPPTLPKSVLPKSLGRPEFDRSALIEFQSQPPGKQKEVLKTEWADAAFILAERLKRFSMTVSRKDFGRLQQLVTSAGIAYDKVFPKGEQVNTVAIHGSVMFNLFGSLGQDKVTKILTPQLPPQLEDTNGRTEAN